MRWARFFIVMSTLALVRSAWAQPRVAAPEKPLDACSISRGSLVLNGVSTPHEPADAFPTGLPVSQPLQPVALPEAEPPLPIEEIVTLQPSLDAELASPPRGLGASWDSMDYLIWWPKAQPLPPLVAANRFGPAIPGQPGTNLLVGGRSLDAMDQSGGRFVMGRSLNEQNTVGLEGIYFFLGTRTLTRTFSDLGNPRLANLGFPYFDPSIGAPNVVAVARPGFGSARIDVSTSTRVQGAELNFVTSLFDGPRVRLKGLAGYRYFQLQEGLRSEAVVISEPRGDRPTGVAQIADQIDAHNRFSGGQLGFAMDVSRGPVFVEFTGKVAIGQNFEVVRIEGQTNTLVGYQPLGQLASYPSGVYAEPSNSGRFTHSAFAVVPEAMFKVGLKLHDRGRFFAAYNFLYLSDAVRPGDQVDSTLDPAQVRLLNPAGGGLSERPMPMVNRTDFWVQGLVLGLEGRY